MGDHATGLAAALADEGFSAPIVRVAWDARGWRASLGQIREELRRLHPDRVILHYSHLAWSARGLPMGLLLVVATCRRFAPVVIWVHDPDRSGSARRRDRLHARVKAAGLRTALRLAGKGVLSVDPRAVYWMRPGLAKRVITAPSASNVPGRTAHPPDDLFTVACFGLLLGFHQAHVDAVTAISAALQERIGPFRWRILGTDPGGDLRWLDHLEERGIVIDRPGYLPADELADRLAVSHAFAAFRAGLSPRSGSTAAAFACGLPVVGYPGPETVAPVDKGGVLIVGAHDWDAMAEALASIARDTGLRDELAALSLRVHDEHYAWDVVAERVAQMLRS